MFKLNDIIRPNSDTDGIFEDDVFDKNHKVVAIDKDGNVLTDLVHFYTSPHWFTFISNEAVEKIRHPFPPNDYMSDDWEGMVP